MSYLNPQKVQNIVDMDKFRKNVRLGSTGCLNSLRTCGSAVRWGGKDRDEILEIRMGDSMTVSKTKSVGSRARQFPARKLCEARALREPVFIRCAQPLVDGSPFQRVLRITDYRTWQEEELKSGILAVWEWRRRTDLPRLIAPGLQEEKRLKGQTTTGSQRFDYDKT